MHRLTEAHQLKLNRREFIALSTAAAIVPATPALALRQPYVLAGEPVDSIVWHLWDDPRNPAPLGPLCVGDIGDWDGVGYPITLIERGWHQRNDFSGWYDFEWSNLRRDLPDRFWQTHSVDIYPNVHSYIREKRFGEPPSIMREALANNEARGRRALQDKEG